MKNSNWEKNQNKLRESINILGVNQLLIHSDIFKSLSFINHSERKDENIELHISFISSLTSNVVLPFFNYEFPKSRKFDFDNFNCATGALPIAFNLIYNNRTFDPMFSMSYISRLDDFSKYQDTVKTFSSEGIFSKLISENSGLLFYGADINTATIIHYVEYMTNVCYRYEKLFNGTTIFEGSKKKITFISHFRPMNNYLEYDWSKIKKDLIDNSLMISIGRHCHLLSMKKLFSYWQQKMKDNIFYFLDKKSLLWVQPKIESLGRSFKVTDFE